MSALYKTKFDGYEERVRQSLRDQPFMSKLLDVNILRIEPGVVELAIPVTAQMLQPHGNVHGIVASAVADSAAGYAAQTLLPEGADMVTVEYKINYLAPGIGERIIAVGKVLRPGRTISICSADVFAESAGERKLFAYFVATMMTVGGN